MTAKRDLKKRVRERQARTGESYMVARRQVIAEAGPRAEPADAPEPRPGAIAVDEVIDLSAAAAGHGLRCRVLMFPKLAERADPDRVLVAVRTALVATGDDPDAELLRGVALRGQVIRAPVRMRDDHRHFVARARAGLGGASRDGRMLALHVEGTAGIVPVLCAAWRAEPTLALMTVDDALVSALSLLGSPVPEVPRAVTAQPTLFLIFEGQRHAMTRTPFVIGRQRSADLQIRDGEISRRHAAVLHRDGAYYLKDLGSHAGVTYRGMNIDNKRIEEGDVFQLGSYELRFTFRADE